MIYHFKQFKVIYQGSSTIVDSGRWERNFATEEEALKEKTTTSSLFAIIHYLQISDKDIAEINIARQHGFSEEVKKGYTDGIQPIILFKK